MQTQPTENGDGPEQGSDGAPPSPEAVRASLAHLDERQQRIVGGLFAVMIKSPAQVREREWMTQQLTEITVLAGDVDADSADAAINAVREYLQVHAEELLRSSLALFQRVGLDLAPRAQQGFSFEEALKIGLAYLPG